MLGLQCVPITTRWCGWVDGAYYVYVSLPLRWADQGHAGGGDRWPNTYGFVGFVFISRSQNGLSWFAAISPVLNAVLCCFAN